MEHNVTVIAIAQLSAGIAAIALHRLRPGLDIQRMGTYLALSAAAVLLLVRWLN